MVSNDSGPPNFASLTEMPTIVLFGPETPLLYKPLGENVQAVYAGFTCSPCVSAYNHRKSLCTDNKCMQAIKVDEVYGRVRDVLKAYRR
jgi:ADP-heptose:LPS heptosyltransferase